MNSVQRSNSGWLPRALLLDRDGTLNVDVGGAPTPDEITLLPHVVEGLQAFAECGVEFFIFTNHATIGRGEDSAENHLACMDRLTELLAAHNLLIKSTRTCPHNPDDHCDCRKPATGMWESLTQEFPELDPADCLMVGDKDTDTLFGKAIGARTARVASGQHAYDVPAMYTCTDLLDLSQQIL